MDKQPQSPIQNDEIDLGQLFKYIENIFKNLARFIKSTLITLFKFVLWFLVYLKNRIVYLALGALIGLIFSIIVNYSGNSFTKYQSNMVVEQANNSQKHIINTVESLNNLISSGNLVKISKTLNIPTAKAESLKEIKIEPFNTSIQLLDMYDDFIENSDSTLVRQISLEMFEENLSVHDFEQFQIQLISTDPVIAGQINVPLLKLLNNNEELNRLRKAKLEALAEENSKFENSMTQITELNTTLKEAYLKENASTNGTNINLGNTESPINPSDLLERYEEAMERITENRLDIADNKNLARPQTLFPEYATKIGKLDWNNNFLKFILTFLIISLVALMFIDIYKFISTLEKNNDLQFKLNFFDRKEEE